MKTSTLFRTLLVLGVLAVLLTGFNSARAATVTFTNNSAIGPANTNYDGADIVVSNCTLTVDGLHGFSSMHVTTGGVLTHTYTPGGGAIYTNVLVVTNESRTLSGTNPVVLVNSNINVSTVTVTDPTGTTNYTNNADYVLTASNAWTLLARTTNSAIPDGSTVLVNYQVTLGTVSPGLQLTITNNVIVDGGGAINADGIGYGGGAGAGAGRSAGSPTDGSGGGYGGTGGLSSSNALGGTGYGSFYTPTNLGSGGGASYLGVGGSGGGIINIAAGGNLIINGSVSANGAAGTNSRSGGGAGGSIWMTGAALAGTGTISAKGGSGELPHGGGGGGGRISLSYNSTSFAGTMTAVGGNGAGIGGAGTVYTKAGAQNGFLLIDNGGQAGTNTLLAVQDYTINIQIQRGGVVFPTSQIWFNNLTIATNSQVVSGFLTTINLTASGAIIVQAGGSIYADSSGYGGNSGSGPGHSSINYLCSGGGYGGYGGASFPTNALGGITYGSQFSPNGYGSGGGSITPNSIGGNGGGSIYIDSLGGIVEVDGTISANGGNGTGVAGGGGSGGTIYMTGGTLQGAGSISANGGSGANGEGGGGGGGRIDLNPSANLFVGSVTAFGGGGGNFGGAGTVLIQVPNGQSQLIIDNGNHSGTNTPVTSQSGTDLVVRNAGVATSSSSVTFANLYLYTNGWIVPTVVQYPATALNFTFTGSATIQPGAGIVGDNTGYAGGAGFNSGAGRTISYNGTNICSGGGHGGPGGSSYLNELTGGLTYDTPTSPADAGSGGGQGSPQSVGGIGGGIIRLTVSGSLEVDGVISANGGAGSGVAGGGGAGGSLYLSAFSVAGGGSIAANGGNGVDSLGGGGGGGMVYLTCTSNLFAGSMTAYGGAGANWGGVGTVVTVVGTGKNPVLVLDGGNRPGPATLLPNATVTDLTMRNGATAVVGPTTFGNVVVGSNCWILVSNSVEPTISMASATIQPGGGIIADLLGAGPGLGTGLGHYYGQSPYYQCSGAGHGGNGGNSLYSAVVGGAAVDNPSAPILEGAGGGTYSPYSFGGFGGGAFLLRVTGLLQNDGIISANGGNGSGLGGGGGSGGSLYLQPGILAGAGTISANGGNGVDSTGGGGAGGCIAITATSNIFAGSITAYGGTGANAGGAGTIYVSATGGTQVILDNGGKPGAGTPIVNPTSSTTVTIRNGAVAYQQTVSQVVGTLVIASNGVLEANPISGNNAPGVVSLTVNGNASIQAGGGIVTDGQGSISGSGTGGGSSGAGGSYGGLGGSSSTATGRNVYGSALSPNANGSGGGQVSYASGGSGGGQVRLTVNGTLALEGVISANGSNAPVGGAGGGSGGSVWLTPNTLTGGGSIAANGGSGSDGTGGGGGGGRISITCTSSSFTGQVTARGGSGWNIGGAGTIYTATNSKGAGQLIVDNGGQDGAGTPLYGSLSLPLPLNLVVQNGAFVPVTAGQQINSINNLTIGAGGQLSWGTGLSDYDLVVLGNLTVSQGGALAVDGAGYAQTFGPGAGYLGGGGGYGGAGGNSTAGLGGPAYGSASQPLDFGSGGGYGSGPTYLGGSGGGGALRLNVAGTLTVNGEISAEGTPGLQDDAGGGSGGSVWITTGTFVGNGEIAADGGAGSPDYGAGGGGGRVAIYSLLNAFAGTTSVQGGAGYQAGSPGTVVDSNGVPQLQVLSSTPTGTVSNAVSTISLLFNEAPASVQPGSISITTPNGVISSGSVTITSSGSSAYQINFPQETAVGSYSFSVSNINDLYGRPMLPYTSSFAVSLPVVQGTVTDTNGNPVAGVVLQPTGGLSSATTDTNGNYSLGFTSGSSFTVTPSFGSLVFAPLSISYTNLSNSIVNQNYTALPTLAATLTSSTDTTNVYLGWFGVRGVNYQIFSSPDLINWTLYSGNGVQSNGAVQVAIPIGTNAQQFFKVTSSE